MQCSVLCSALYYAVLCSMHHLTHSLARFFVLQQVNVTADHRIIYGADLAEFLQTFANVVENPDQLTL